MARKQGSTQNTQTRHFFFSRAKQGSIPKRSKTKLKKNVISAIRIKIPTLRFIPLYELSTRMASSFLRARLKENYLFNPSRPNFTPEIGGRIDAVSK